MSEYTTNELDCECLFSWSKDDLVSEVNILRTTLEDRDLTIAQQAAA